MANSQGTVVATVAAEHDARAAPPQYRTRSMLSITLRRLARSYSALWGLCMVCGLILIAVLADVIAPYGPAQIVAGGGSLDLPTWAHPMGLDLLGRDVFSRVVYSSRIAIYVGIVSIILALLPGIPLGIVAGFYGGPLDKLIMAVMDVILAFPIFLLAIVIMVVLEPSTTNVVIALGIVRIPIYARVVRGSVLSVKENEYIEAVRAPGAQALAGLVPPCAAQLHGPDYYYQHALSVDLDPHRIVAELLGTGHTAADAELGMGSESEPGVYRYQSLDRGVPGAGHFSDHAGVQHAGRRPARRPGSTLETLVLRPATA